MAHHHPALRKVTSRSLPDLTCSHEEHGHHLHDLTDEQSEEQADSGSILLHQQHQHHSLTAQDSGSSDSPSCVKRHHHQHHQLLQHHLRDNQLNKLSLLSSAHFRPFFHSSSSSLSSESCHSHSLPPHSNPLLSKDTLSSSLSSGGKVPAEEDFESLKLISNGAYGAVYLVRHKETNQRFAMKKINKLNLVLRNQVEQVFAERDIMSFTDNPFVVSMFCSFETKRHLCMVMEYVEGGDCAILLKNMGPLPVDLARFYFGETLLAVEYLHSIGIVHRDLKPDNLLITAMGHIKLTDFGLSKIGLMNLATNLYEGYLDRETRQFTDKQVFGTPEYIAPEVILRQGYGKPVDWWSMGIILYEFLVGCVPFFGETPEELFAHVINDEPEWPDEDEWPIPEEAKSLITALLMRNPLDRLGTAGATEVKAHSFFGDINWDDLLRQKAEFIPHLDGEDDTSYFDTRSDRYNHETGDDGESLEETDDSGSLFSSFSSCSPRYHKAYSRIEKELAEERLLKSSSASSIAIEPHPSTKSLPRSADRTHLKGMTQTSSSMDVILQRTRSLTVANPCDASKELDSSPNNNEDEKREHRMSLSSSCASSVSVSRDSQRKISVEDGSESGRKSNTQSTTPDLSQNESETDASPKIERRKRGLSLRSNLPRFSICIDSDFLASAALAAGAAMTPTPTTPCTPSIREIPPADEDSTDSPAVDGLSPCIQSSVHQHQHHRHGDHSHPSSPTIPIPGLTSGHHRPRSVTKSASVAGLSLIIPPPEETSNMNLTVHAKTGTVSASGSKNPPSGPRSLTSPGHSSTSSRDTSPNRDITNCLTSQLKPPIIIRRGPRGFGFTLRAIRVYFGDTDVYTLHHLVMHVENNSPAFEAGLRPGDLVTHINGESIQGLLHPQVLQLVLSGGDKINIRSTPLENTTIRTGGRKRNHKTSKLIRRQIISKHRRTPPIRRSDSDKRRNRSSNLFRRLSSKRASAEIQQLMLNPVSPMAITPSRSFQSLAQATPGYSSQSSSPGSSVPNSPALVNSPNFQPRPSSLYGLKNKLVKTCRHHQTAIQSPRRKSCGHIPLSPLARTPSPSVHLIAASVTSPTRSPSPLAFPPGGHAASTTTPASGSSSSGGTTTAGCGRKKVFHPLVSKSYQ